MNKVLFQVGIGSCFQSSVLLEKSLNELMDTGQMKGKSHFF